MIDNPGKPRGRTSFRDLLLFCVRLALISGILATLRIYTAGYSLTLESLILITCSEVNIWKEKVRQRRHRSGRSDFDIEKVGDANPKSIECVGAIVGYREDSVIFKNCLNSYRENHDNTMRALVIGIDGNQTEDLPMIEAAEEV